MPQLDKTCTDMLNDIQQHFRVIFEKWNNNHCAFQVTARNENHFPTECKIYYYDGFRAAEICHELLHAKCEYIFGNDKDLLLDKSFPLVMQLVMDFSFWQSFSNQVQHKIMYEEYIAKGYVPNDFFGYKATVSMKVIRDFAKKGLKDSATQQYNPVTLKCYMNVLLHLLLYPCGGNFNRELAILENMDKELYVIHHQLFQAIRGAQLTPADKSKVSNAKQEYRAQMHAWFQSKNVKLPSLINLKEMEQLITD